MLYPTIKALVLQLGQCAERRDYHAAVRMKQQSLYINKITERLAKGYAEMVADLVLRATVCSGAGKCPGRRKI